MASSRRDRCPPRPRLKAAEDGPIEVTRRQPPLQRYDRVEMSKEAGGSSGPAEPVSPELVIGLNAVIIAVTGDHPRVLTVSLPGDTPIEGGGAAAENGSGKLPEALPIGPLDPAGDRTLELAVRPRAGASSPQGFLSTQR